MHPQTSIPTTNPATNPQSDTPAPYQAPKKNNHEGLKSILFTIAILVSAPLLALFLTTFVFQSYRVDGESMETSLQHNDRLLIWKLPRSIANLRNSTYMPERGDIIVFTKPDMIDVNGQQKQLIKRVVGLPGDRVVVKDGAITVYNNEHPDGFNPDQNQPFSQFIDNTTRGDIDVEVRQGEVFVCGDNRSNSLDSRSFGSISTDDISGTLSYRIFPLSKFDRF